MKKNISNADKRRKLARKNGALGVLMMLFFVGVLLVFYNMIYIEKRDNIIKDGQAAALSTAAEFSDYLSTAEEAMEVTSYTLDGMLRDNRSNREILDHLTAMSDAVINTVLENTSGMYGWINGEYLDGVGWVPDDDYVPTERPWYTGAFGKGDDITVIAPYLDAQTNTVMIGLSKVLCDGVSVVSYDISLDRIQEITEGSVKSDRSDIEIITDEKGTVVAHSDKDEVGKNYYDENGTFAALLMDSLNSSQGSFCEFYYNDLHYIAYSADIWNNWRCISVVDATSDFIPLRRMLFVTIAIILAIVIIISAVMIKSNERQITAEMLNSRLSSTADIYISVHEIDLLADTFTEVRNIKAAASRMIRESRNSCQQTIHAIMERFSDDSTKESILDFVDFSKLDKRLADCNTITSEFLSSENRWRRARFIVSERLPDGRISRAMYLIEDIDTEKRRRDMALEVAKKLNDQISSLANIYVSMYDVDIPNDILCEIKTDADSLSDLVGGNIENAQEAIYTIAEHLVNKKSRASAHDFFALSTLNERLKDTDTVTEEFMTFKKEWYRARFVVSKRGPDGNAEHVLWVIEGIDAEMKKRQKLAESAETLNNRMSSISNIYTTVYELDIENDTFTEIKTSGRISVTAGENRVHLQETVSRIMESVTDASFADEMMRFVDLSTLGKRLYKADTVSIEYINHEKLWRRGRFVVSKRGRYHSIARVLFLIEDIDGEKQEQDKLRDISERAVAANEAKSSFLSHLSHEIRTPISAVLGMNEMILRECDDKNILEYSENIRTAGNTLLALINDILDLSKIESGRMEIVPVDYDLSSVINDLVNMVRTRADEKALMLVLNFDSEMPKLLNGDEVRIKQILMNILTNAVKYTEEGSIEFGMSCEKKFERSNSVILDFWVKDTGIGIKPEDMKKLFSASGRIDDEHSRNTGGAGLGMNITKRLLEMMGSSLKAESVYDLGTKFSFRLKQKVVKWEPLGDYESAYKASLGRREKYHEKFTAPDVNVLVVDDTPMNITVFRSLLKQTKIKIDSAGSGDEGIALAYDKKYDLIFLDHMMPGKDGIQTLHEMRAGKNAPNADTPVICLTANAISGAREKYLAEGFDGYITKPVDPEKLEEMLLSCLPEDKLICGD